MIKHIFLLTLMSASLQATVISDFQADSISAAPSGWHVGNPWTVQLDPTNASNHVLDTSSRANAVSFGNPPGNQVAGTEAIIGATSTMTLQFDFYMQTTSLIDLSIGMTSTSDLTTIAFDDGGSFFGPLIRLDDGVIRLFDGDGSGSGSFTNADQSVSSTTWYTISMVIDNQNNSYTASIVGGAFATETTLSSGSTSSFAFRSDDSNDLVNFVYRANSGNTSTSGVIFDNISIIPEPSTYALLLSCIAIVALHRRLR